jgi:hypothetical protein
LAPCSYPMTLNDLWGRRGIGPCQSDSDGESADVSRGHSGLVSTNPSGRR